MPSAGWIQQNLPAVPPVLLSGTIEGGGTLEGVLAATQLLSGTIEGGGTLSGRIEVGVELEGTLRSQQLLWGDANTFTDVGSEPFGGSTLSGDIFVGQGQFLAGTIEGGGSFDGALSITRPLSGTLRFQQAEWDDALTFEEERTFEPDLMTANLDTSPPRVTYTRRHLVGIGS